MLQWTLITSRFMKYNYDGILYASIWFWWQCFQGRAGTCPPISGGKHLSAKQKLPSESDIENYAQQHLNKHKKGLFGKNVPLTNMLKWSKVGDSSYCLLIRTHFTLYSFSLYIDLCMWHNFVKPITSMYSFINCKLNFFALKINKKNKTSQDYLA